MSSHYYTAAGRQFDTIDKAIDHAKATMTESLTWETGPITECNIFIWCGNIFYTETVVRMDPTSKTDGEPTFFETLC